MKLATSLTIELLGDIRNEWCDTCLLPSTLVGEYAIYSPNLPLHRQTVRRCEGCGLTSAECHPAPEREQ